MGAHEMGYSMTQGEIEFIKKTEEGCAAFMFICGGFLAGLEAGLLDGKTATAPRFMIEQLRQGHSQVQWVEKRWANDGKIWTSGALLNGTDMTRAFALQTWGGEGSLAEFGMRLGGYPDRDVDYADVPYKI
jgi:transcriptional regulator GlxA family with amidase domain